MRGTSCCLFQEILNLKLWKHSLLRGRSGGAKVPALLLDSPALKVLQGPVELAVGTDGGCLDIFFVYLFSFLSPSVGDGPI